MVEGGGDGGRCKGRKGHNKSKASAKQMFFQLDVGSSANFAGLLFR